MLRDDPQFATNSYYERDFETKAVKISPGEYFVRIPGEADRCSGAMPTGIPI